MWYNLDMEYKSHLFDICGQLSKELDDFFTTKVKINGTKYNHKNASNKGYQFNQAETLNLIEFVGASKFEKGDIDDEGRQKVYLNSSVFRADVAAKQIDIDVKDILFIPDDWYSEVATIISRKKFKKWTKDTGFSVELNEMVERLPFYGSLVIKEREDTFDIVPLSQIRNQQNCKDLNSASYVVIEHQMQAWEAQAMPDWDLSGLEYKWDDEITVYERYGRVPVQFFDEDADETESVDTHSFIVLDAKNKKKEGKLLFIEKISKRPFREVHWKKREGRWLGVGEIENNFENQKARNMVFNLRLRSAFWSSKNIFQSSDIGVAKNLVAEVRDGDVLEVTQGGGIQPVNTQTKALADYNSIDQSVEDNSDKKAFTFEVASGESLPSGTPFRLGVVLANSVNSHFGLKREKLSLFVKDCLYSFILPKFEKSLAEKDIELITSNDEGYELLFELIVNAKLYKFVKEKALKEGRIPTEEEKQAFINEVKRSGKFEIEVLRDELKNTKYSIDIVITGESINLEKRIETLTNLYQSLAQAQDPRAEQILQKLIVLTGEKLPQQEVPTGVPQEGGVMGDLIRSAQPNEQQV